MRNIDTDRLLYKGHIRSYRRDSIWNPKERRGVKRWANKVRRQAERAYIRKVLSEYE